LALVESVSQTQTKPAAGLQLAFGIGLVVLTFQMQAGGFNLANADELAEFYPGRYVGSGLPYLKQSTEDFINTFLLSD
jgi:hypothetical protein